MATGTIFPSDRLSVPRPGQGGPGVPSCAGRTPSTAPGTAAHGGSRAHPAAPGPPFGDRHRGNACRPPGVRIRQAPSGSGQKKASSPIRGSSAGLQAIWIRPAAGSRPGPGVALRLGQPSMADSPPQRIHALLSATPAPERPSPSHRRSFSRGSATRAAMSRALAPGDCDKQNMDVLRASQGRMP